MESCSCVKRLDSVMKNDLTPEQFARYRAEVEKREAFQKQAAVRYLVDAIDRDLYLSDEQRLKLAESLSVALGLELEHEPGVPPVCQPVLSGRRRSLRDTVPGCDTEKDMGRAQKVGRTGGSVWPSGLVHE